MAKFCEMIVSYWREVGIDATTKEIQYTLYKERMRNGQVHVGVWHADRCTDMLLHIEPQWFIPTRMPAATRVAPMPSGAPWYNCGG